MPSKNVLEKLETVTSTGQPGRLMLTVLGMGAGKARYTLNGKEVESDLAPVALVELLPEEERPDRVLALCTPEARNETWPKLEELLRGRFCVEPVDVPAGDDQDGIAKFLEAVTRAVPRDVDLTVDVTHGFRHLSFLTYVSVLYLAALRGVQVRGAYYGLLNRDAPSPFLDLRPLLELPRWVHALEVLGETGSALPMAELLEADSQAAPVARDISRDLRRLSEAYLSGLPLELGLQARKMSERNKPLGRLPLERELRDQLAEIIKPFELGAPVARQVLKKGIALSEGELLRQACIIDDLLNHGHTATALGLMNEWTVSWVIWRRRPDAEWLNYRKVRKRAASLLGAIAAIRKTPELRADLTEEQRSLGDFWNELTELRNGYSHYGMRPQDLISDKNINGKVDKIRKYWDTTLKSLPGFPLSIGDSPGGLVLVSPIGLRPGVLFSAVMACQAGENLEEPTTCLIICSKKSEDKIDGALKQAGYGGRFEPLLLKDAFGGGSEEIERLVKDARKHLIGADEVVVNVTGGTTLMGLAAEAIASEARRFARPTRRFGLIDRRPTDQQDADPYQAGEPFWLDGPEDDDANRD